MGSTITTGRAAAAVRTSQGRVLYALFEETYCSNVSPKIPSWCCVGLGYLQSAMQRIFELASSCEGGMLRGRGGPLTPEGYIASWLGQLADPLVLHGTEVELTVGDGIYSAVHPARLDDAAGILGSKGRTAEAAVLREGKAVTLDLCRDAEAILALQDGLQLAPWLLVGRGMLPHRTGARDAALGYAPEPRRAPTPDVPMALKLDDHVRLLRDADGTWRCGGWEHSIVAQHVEGMWEAELAFPGHYRKQIKAFRTALANAPPTPAGLVVEIDEHGVKERYHLGKIQKLREQAGAGAGVFRVPLTDDDAWKLTNLPSDCTKWLLPEEHQAARSEQAAFGF